MDEDPSPGGATATAEEMKAARAMERHHYIDIMAKETDSLDTPF